MSWSQRPNLSLRSRTLFQLISGLSRTGRELTNPGPNFRTRRCDTAPPCRALADLGVPGTESNNPGPNAGSCRCATEPPYCVLAGFPVPGTDSTTTGPDARIYRCATEPPCRVLAGSPVAGAVHRCSPTMHYCRGQVVVATSAKPRERNAILPQV